MELLYELDEKDACFFFLKDLQDIEPEKEIKEEIQMKDDFLSKMIERIVRVFQTISESGI